MARSEGVQPVVVIAVCLIAIVCIPLFPIEDIISTLTATPLRQAVSVFVASIIIGVGLLWAVSPFIGHAVDQASAKRTWGQGGDD